MGTTKEKKILVVDDEEDVRNYLKTALEDAGFQVIIAKDGFEAFEKTEKELPDLVSLDLVMPKHSGVKFYHDVKKNKDLSRIPILIVTGHARDDLGKADFDTLTIQGPGVYLEKPVSPNKYVSKICEMLNIETPNEFVIKKDDTTELKNELFSSLANADADALKKALEAIKKSKD